MPLRRMKDYQALLKALLSTIAEKSSLQSEPPLRDVLAANPKMVVAFSHATPLSWIPAACLLATETVENGGENRIPRGIVDRFFYQWPMLRWVGQFVSQTDRPQTFDELLETFKASESSDLVVFPEGSNCFLEPVDQIQNFRSPRFVEFAIRAHCPVLLAVHRGSELWASTQELPTVLKNFMALIPSSFLHRMAAGGVINVPVPTQKIPNFQMLCRLYVPTLKESELSADPAERRLQIEEEAARVREKMAELHAKLTAEE